MCAWAEEGEIARIEAALSKERPHPRRIHLFVRPATVVRQETGEADVVELSEAEQNGVVVLADRLLAASEAEELIVVWCGDEPLCALDVIQGITDELRIVTANHGAGIRAVVVTKGELLDSCTEALLASCRVKRVRVAVAGPGPAFDTVMENLLAKHRYRVEICMKVDDHNAEAAVQVRTRVEAAARESGNSLAFVDSDAFEGSLEEPLADDVMTVEEIGAIAVPIFRRWGFVRAWVFGSFASGWANARSDIDMMAELPRGVHIGLRYFDLRRELKEALGRRVELHMPPYKSEGDPFINLMERSRVLLFEDEE